MQTPDFQAIAHRIAARCIDQKTSDLILQSVEHAD
jgi:hypothetical protein